MLQTVSSSDEGALAHDPANMDVPSPATFEINRTHKDVFGALLRAKREFGGKKIAVVDGDGTEFDYLTIARYTGGSVHTIEDDLQDLRKVHDGETYEIDGSVYRLEKGRFILQDRG